MSVFVCPHGKVCYASQQSAERAAKKLGRKFLSAYACPLGDRNHWHLTKQKQGVRKMDEFTAAEQRHLKNKLADLGRQIANEADRHNRATAKRQAADIAEFNRKQAEQAVRDKAHADRLADLQDTLRIAAALNVRVGK
jgi:hypothetical protein